MKTQNKVDFIIDIIRFEKHIPNKFFKHLKGTNGIYEIRIMVAQGSIRILSFYDKGNLINQNRIVLKDFLLYAPH